MAKCVLETINLRKSFGGIQAVNNVNIKLYENEILAIVGDNGAGKSTLIKIITGVYKKDDGKICIEGKEAKIKNTIDARRCGIETVYQDKGLIQVLDASSNLFLGREKFQENILGKLFKFLDMKYMKQETKELYKRFGLEIMNLDEKVNLLSGGQQQSLVVGRAVYWGGKIIIFDEPTNNLGVGEQNKAIDLIKQVRKNSKASFIIITHNLYHVFEIADRIIVLRNGLVVGERIKNKTTRNEIISMITGLAS